MSPKLSIFFNHILGSKNLKLIFFSLNGSGTETSESMEINQWKCSTKNFDRSNCVLIALDGTWKHAKEMMRASLEFLSKFAVQVYLSYDTSIDGGTIFNSDLILRKEPFSGCMSTMEAVAQCLQVLDPNGVEIEARLLEVLRTMVRFQTSYLRPMKQRPKLVKKTKVDGKRNN